VIRRALAAGSCVMVLAAIGIAGCGGDDNSSKGGGPGSTMQPAPTMPVDDSPTDGPQTGPNPAGGEPVAGSTPAAG
jgi:hypothetical protein